jgi:hypothetical protein
MASLYNLARMTTNTSGTGAALTLATVVPGFLSFDDAGVGDGDTVSYGIVDGANTEVGRGVYTAAGTTLTRGVLKSTNADARIDLSGAAAEVYISFLSDDFNDTIKADGSVPFSGNQSFGDNDITNVGDIALDTISADGASIIINPAGADVDVRFAGDNDANLLYLDGGSDFITIGSTTEIAKFGIDGNANEIQFCIQGHSTQDYPYIILEKSDGTDFLGIRDSALNNTGMVDIRSGRLAMMIGGDNNTTGTRTDGVAKVVRIAFPHKTNAEEPHPLILGSDSAVSYGGGSSLFNAVTEQRFYTAANSTTTTGTVRLTIDSAGDFTFFDGADFILGTTTGTKFGTAANQKIGFFGAGPIVQLAKADYNNWAAFTDVVDALVAIGLFDAA